jgi:hypothetical protein
MDVPGNEIYREICRSPGEMELERSWVMVLAGAWGGMIP